MLAKLKDLLHEEEGQGMTEYGLVLGIIAIAAIVAIGALREQIVGLFNDAADRVSNARTEINEEPTE